MADPVEVSGLQIESFLFVTENEIKVFEYFLTKAQCSKMEKRKIFWKIVNED